MNLDNANPIREFTARYLDCWQRSYGHEPKSAELHGMPSPCIVKTVAMEVYWQPVVCQPANNFSIAEEMVGIRIRPEIATLLGSQFAGDMRADHHGLALNLLQAWNEADFQRLEQNQIAHLQMQRRLKRPPTLFIASVDDDSQLVSVNNLTGQVVCEDLISGEQQILADSVNQFITQLQPRLA